MLISRPHDDIRRLFHSISKAGKTADEIETTESQHAMDMPLLVESTSILLRLQAALFIHLFIMLLLYPLVSFALQLLLTTFERNIVLELALPKHRVEQFHVLATD